MNWLLDNPISRMPMPMFLALHAGLTALTCVEAFFARRRGDRSRDLGPMPIPAKPDPYEIAYLRDGENALTRLIVFDLIRRGYLRVREEEQTSRRAAESWIERSPDYPEVEQLSPVEAVAFDYFAKPDTPEALFKPAGLASELKLGLEPMAEPLRDQQLLTSPERCSAAWRTWLSGALMILALSGFKLAVALPGERYGIAILLVFTLVVLGGFCVVPRVTRRGEDYLARLREAFEGLKTRVVESQPSDSIDPAILLVAALFGVAALAGTPHGYVPALFQTASASGGGCAGGCGEPSSGDCGD